MDLLSETSHYYEDVGKTNIISIICQRLQLIVIAISSLLTALSGYNTERLKNNNIDYWGLET